MYTYREPEKLLYHGPKKQIDVVRLLGTRDDTEWKEMLKVELDFGWEIVVAQKKRPRSLLPTSVRCEAISRQAKCNITSILEVLVGELAALNNNVAGQELAVFSGVHDVSVSGLCVPRRGRA